MSVSLNSPREERFIALSTNEHAIPEACLEPTEYIDCTHESIRACVCRLISAGDDPRRRAVKLFEFVRDNVAYEFMIRTRQEEYRASFTLREGRGFCVRKAILLCALGRAAGIPSALVLSDLRDHSLSARVKEALGTDMMYHHGFTAFHLDGRWLMADASLSPQLVEKRGYKLVEFDGRSDALQSPVTQFGTPHMEYMKIHGLYPDLPVGQMFDAFLRNYRDARPHMLTELGLNPA